jgi:opacity protein-like surface antigen|tara:strand:- start:141 stop:782 length:642 start_codon:yes stop_codon:yes gene_type:complete
MKIKNILTLSAITIGLASQQAFAESSNYFKIGGNLSLASSFESNDYPFSINTKSGVMPEITFGHTFNKRWGVEVGYQRAANAIENTLISGVGVPAIKGDLQLETFMIKGIYQLSQNTSPMFQPYAGLGFGNTSIKVAGMVLEGDDGFWDAEGTTASTQLTLGNRFSFNDGWFGDLAVNYTDLGKPKITYRSGLIEEFKASAVTSVSFAVGSKF